MGEGSRYTDPLSRMHRGESIENQARQGWTSPALKDIAVLGPAKASNDGPLR